MDASDRQLLYCMYSMIAVTVIALAGFIAGAVSEFVRADTRDVPQCQCTEDGR